MIQNSRSYQTKYQEEGQCRALSCKEVCQVLILTKIVTPLPFNSRFRSCSPHPHRYSWSRCKTPAGAPHLPWRCSWLIMLKAAKPDKTEKYRQTPSHPRMAAHPALAVNFNWLRPVESPCQAPQSGEKKRRVGSSPFKAKGGVRPQSTQRSAA